MASSRLESPGEIPDRVTTTSTNGEFFTTTVTHATGPKSMHMLLEDFMTYVARSAFGVPRAPSPANRGAFRADLNNDRSSAIGYQPRTWLPKEDGRREA
jgi:hypothetical protein